MFKEIDFKNHKIRTVKFAPQFYMISFDTKGWLVLCVGKFSLKKYMAYNRTKIECKKKRFLETIKNL
jgi:hypothetical protein